MQLGLPKVLEGDLLYCSLEQIVKERQLLEGHVVLSAFLANMVLCHSSLVAFSLVACHMTNLLAVSLSMSK